MGLGGRLSAPPTEPDDRPAWKKAPVQLAALALVVLCLLACVALFATLAKEWTAGTAFHRYKNWKGVWVSHADVLIFVVVCNVALVAGLVWRRWDRWRLQREDDEIIEGARRRRR